MVHNRTSPMNNLLLAAGSHIAVAGPDSSGCRAQDIVVPPPIPPIPPIAATGTGCRGRCNRWMPSLTVRWLLYMSPRSFAMTGSRAAEGVYLFPLPLGAAVSDFQMTVNGQTLEGRLLDQAEARRIYEEIVRRQLDPALLEYIGRGVFQASVFPIPAGETRKVEFTYHQVIAAK